MKSWARQIICSLLAKATEIVKILDLLQEYKGAEGPGTEVVPGIQTA